MSSKLGEGMWGRRELGGLVLVFGGALLAASVGFFALCAAKPDNGTNACRLLDVAMQEADMSEGWYIEAGKALERCGVKEARAESERKACFARRRNDATINCE